MVIDPSDIDNDTETPEQSIEDALNAAHTELGGESGADQAAGAAATPAAAGNATAGAQGAAPAPGAGEQPFEPPARWPQAAKDAWKALHGYPDSRPHMQQMHDTWQQTQAYLTQQEQQRSRLERTLQPFNDLIEPYAQQWAQQGIDPVSGLRQVMSYADALAKDPQGTLLQLAQEYGVDLRAAMDEQPWVDPVVSQLQQQVQQLTAHITNQGDQSRQSQQQALVREIQAFETEKDADGQLLRPYFGEVFQDMLTLAQLGHAKTPAQAYEMATRFNPAIAQRIAADQQRAAEQAAIAKARQTTAATSKAVNASGITKGKGQPSRGTESLDDALNAVWAEAQR